MASIFTRIVKGEIPAHKILEDAHFLAFLDLNPINPGHTLVIPKKEVDYLFDLDRELLSGILPFAKNVASAIRKAVPCRRIGIMVAGLEVPHAHIHLIPILESLSELSFARASKAPPEELAAMAAKIKAVLE